ncbi:type II secretion system F family protein [Motilimonas sp. E26]|uniref:type II secretion system F family protein n=1 Tax=Motilimonas sp. E26 TaxID=2865674 RepID=UPI001E58044C|nr:type II secretion system F family protein [Motilimonas sp. E26]MCE0555731.1 type II secretion system F family protein [Motilimonas sp. E26]
MAVAKAKSTPKVFTFKWSGVNRKGKKVSGEMQSESATQLKAEMRRQGVNITKVVKKTETIFDRLGNKVKPMDIAIISRQIATMLSAGVPLVQSLQMIAKSNEKPAIRDLIGTISTEVETGTPLSEALKKHPKYFDDLYCDLVQAGEQSGALESLFDRIAVYKEKAEALKSKIKKAMFYPAMVVVVAIIVTTILLLFVIPQFEEIFNGFGAELPAFTQFVIGISNLMQSYWYIVFGTIAIIIFAFKRAHLSSQNVRDNTDKFVLKIPVISTILHKAAMARFARTLSTTFAAGIPLIDALLSAAGASGNYVYRSAILNIRNEVIAGMQMHVAMRTTGVFPDMVTQMIMIGEESGDLDGMLNKVADIFEREVDDAVDGLTSMLEPLIMVVLGVVVGGLVIAMYLPIFTLGQVVG